MLTDKEVGIALTRTMGERVTKEQIEARIAQKGFDRIGATVTICSIVLDNGYSVRGENACVDPANYNAGIGEKLAYDDAFRKLWPLFGFLLAERRHIERCVVASEERAVASPPSTGPFAALTAR